MSTRVALRLYLRGGRLLNWLTGGWWHEHRLKQFLARLERADR